MKHSAIVGGSTAKRVMNCPGSVALSQQVPAQPASSYANEGTLLHDAIAKMLDGKPSLDDVLGMKYEDAELTMDLVERKLIPALTALQDIDPTFELEYETESRVHFGDLLPGVFGSTDLIGRLGDRAVVLDWKFGDGVAVEAEENPQLMFYAAAAMRTPETAWAFENVKALELIIVQPPSVKRWVTTFDRIRQFERELVHAVHIASREQAPLRAGDHCKFCPAKAICPEMTDAAARVLRQRIDKLNAQQIASNLATADMLEDWITELRKLALQMLEQGASVPGYKLVAKRATRQWIDDNAAREELLKFLPESEVLETSVISPAQAEKKLKKLKQSLPKDHVVAISSGNTLASVDDPRPEVLLVGQQMKAALSKLI